ncbi:MAG: methylenetetrahydrofolate reductase [NAD(P)H] [Defluviitaleaceae bacterium]|nr:methylenetetrahydrofolate reductase [NAD(P)H] [Defluviitaleaceae bacterium]MCL2263706.1 methylenetetrahydrofolate reductase [NAD(P)H] [Defluviitaleaceae bacterium]
MNTKITEIFKQNEITVSLELFPPKPGAGFENINKVVGECAKLKPSFMSVTCGAGGGGSTNTLEVVKEVQGVNGIAALAHLVCVSLGRDEVAKMLADLKAQGIHNIMALRGDLPQGVTENTGYYRYASDLIAEIHKNGDFCVGGGCYPEGHPEAATLHKDIENLKIKVDEGCQFLTTQMFFDNNILYNFMFRLLKNGIDVPVVAGIMPVTNAKQIERIFKLSGAPVPPRFKAIVDRFSDNPKAMRQAGIAYATEQIIDLIANGVNNIHIYTMNKPEIAKSIMDNLSEIF